MGRQFDLKVWLLAMRPWSFTAAAVPVSVGALLAYAQGFPFLWGRFLITLLAGVILQTATNFLNTYGDYQSGVDTPESAAGLSQLVNGAIQPGAIYRAGLYALTLSALLGIILVFWCGWPLLIFGICGISGAYFYTTGFCPYKYKGLGPFMVFFLMGPLMVMPAYFIQSGSVSLFSFWASIPIACLVAAIMHANDVRDIAHDRKAGIRTLAINLGRYKAVKTLETMYLGAFISTVILGFFQPGFFLPLILLPSALYALKPLHGDMADLHLSTLDVRTAKLHFQFGLLIMGGLFITAWLRG